MFDGRITQGVPVPDAKASRVANPMVKLDEPGSYCLRSDLTLLARYYLGFGTQANSNTGWSIVIVSADDVTLDLKGHSVVNKWYPSGILLVQFFRLQSEWGRDRSGFLRTTIRNGTFVSPGPSGIGIDLRSFEYKIVQPPPGSRGEDSFRLIEIPEGQTKATHFRETAHRLEDLILEAGDIGIQINGRNNVIRNNRILIEADRAVIAVGPGLVLENNEIEIRGRQREDSSPAPRRVPVQLIQADGAIVRNNRIRYTGTLLGRPPEVAFELVDSEDVVLDGNRIEGIPALERHDDKSSLRR